MNFDRKPGQFGVTGESGPLGKLKATDPNAKGIVGAEVIKRMKIGGDENRRSGSNDHSASKHVLTGLKYKSGSFGTKKE
jgi:hypothetical protein